MEFLRKDTYVVAAAPAVVFLGVYAYELGRYYFLRVPASFIDVSVNRLLASGAIVGALAAVLMGLATWAWKLYFPIGGVWRAIAATAIAMIYFTLPFALWLSRAPINGDGYWTLLSVTGAGASVVSAVQALILRHHSEALVQSMRDGKDPSTYNWSGLPPILTSGVVVALMLVWTLAAFAGLGYFVERRTTERQCVGSAFVADVRGDTLVLKDFVRSDGEILRTTRFLGVEGATLSACSLQLVGAPGLTDFLID
ncbi:hypothetical protein AB9H29_14525 [Stenotrophomonas sepilia]|uniref:hypothetical protein n=1 Tax=Stenotrophomonas sepilia TaxID=2860290 RepID=UPI003556B844